MEKIITAFKYFAKHSILNLWEGSAHMWGFKYVRVLNIPGLSICQASEYSRIINMAGLWISRIDTWFTYFRKYDSLLNMRWEATMEGFWIFQDSEICQTFAYVSIAQGTEYAWIWLNITWINCPDRYDYGRVLNRSDQSFTRFWICL